MVGTENSNGAISVVVRVGDRVTAGITVVLLQLDLSRKLWRTMEVTQHS